jgi:hypothetical protein
MPQKCKANFYHKNKILCFIYLKICFGRTPCGFGSLSSLLNNGSKKRISGRAGEHDRIGGFSPLGFYPESCRHPLFSQRMAA